MAENTKIKMLMGLDAKVKDVPAVPGQLLFSTDTGKITLDTIDSGRIVLYKSVIDDVETLQNLVGSTSVSTQIKNAITALINGTDPDAEITLVTDVVGGDGISIDSTDPSSPIVKVKLASGNNAITVDDSGALKVDVTAFQDYSINVTSTSDDSAKLKRYTITQGDLSFDLDIPTDLIVSSSAVVTDPEGKPAGTYLTLTIGGETQYIDVSTLVKAATAKNAENADVIIAVSAESEISATLSQAVKDNINLATTAVQPSDLAHDAVSKKYIAGVQIDGSTGAITYITEDLPEGGTLLWETF